MRGRVSSFDKKTGKGIIVSENRVKYEFYIYDWLSDSKPFLGMFVEFKTEGCLAVEITDLKQISDYYRSAKHERIGYCFYLLFLLIPVMGYIFNLIWKEDKPLKAEGAIRAAKWGLIISSVFWFIVFILLLMYINALFRSF